MTSPARASWSTRLLFAAALAFGVLFVLDLAACWVLLSPALLGLAACGIWFRWGRAGRRAGRWLAAVLLVGTAVWYGASSGWLVAPEDAYEATPPATYVEEVRAGDEVVVPSLDEVDPRYAEDVASVSYYSSQLVTSSWLVPGAGPVGAVAAVVALAGVGLGRPGRAREQWRRPTWDVREILLIVLAVLMVAVGGWTVPTGLGPAAVVLWLARVGPPGVRPRWLAGATLGLLAVALGLGVWSLRWEYVGAQAGLTYQPADPSGAPPVAAALLAAAFALVATAPLATVARALRRRAEPSPRPDPQSGPESDEEDRGDQS